MVYKVRQQDGFPQTPLMHSFFRSLAIISLALICHAEFTKECDGLSLDDTTTFRELQIQQPGRQGHYRLEQLHWI
jgi:hypothetical protein